MILYPAKIALPDFSRQDGTKWACVACDQFTSEPAYWEACERTVGDAPSALRLILPEVYLHGDVTERISAINRTMREYQNTVLRELPPSFILVERTQPDGRVRLGLVGAIDLEDYSFAPDATTPIRSTEGTVADRIPPRVAIRKDALYELPHVMLLLDDPTMSVIEPLADRADLPTLYDFDLMEGGGHIRGRAVDAAEAETLSRAILATAPTGEHPMVMAVGDGNHSLATAKTIYEDLKAKSPDEAKTSPARYALVEVVNLHSPALDFEPIYRTVEHLASTDALVDRFEAYAAACAADPACTGYPSQTFTCISASGTRTVTFLHGSHTLPVGTVQRFLDAEEDLAVDYIHGEDSLAALASFEGTLGISFAGMQKSELFSAVTTDGPLPRKTFSMGHARDKRYYVEARRIK